MIRFRKLVTTSECLKASTEKNTNINKHTDTCEKKQPNHNQKRNEFYAIESNKKKYVVHTIDVIWYSRGCLEVFGNKK